MPLSRRAFLKRSAAAAAGVAASAGILPAIASEPLYRISLAEWSLNRPLFAGTLDHLDFARTARSLDIEAIEYVNQFFMDKARDAAYLQEMKRRADGEGVRSVLIMCDNEGRLGDPDAAARAQAVENHHKWVEAAAFLGCHSIRVNGYSEGSFEEQQRLVADGLGRLAEFAEQHGLSVLIENHGGYSSHAKWLAGVMERADRPNVGTLPDFGNFRIDEDESYDSYQGVAELMPYAKGVSVKPRVWDFHSNQSDLDYVRMMKIVVDAGYHGYCGIEHGEKDRELASIAEIRDRLLAAREELAKG